MDSRTRTKHKKRPWELPTETAGCLKPMCLAAGQRQPQQKEGRSSNERIRWRKAMNSLFPHPILTWYNHAHAFPRNRQNQPKAPVLVLGDSEGELAAADRGGEPFPIPPIPTCMAVGLRLRRLLCLPAVSFWVWKGEILHRRLARWGGSNRNH